MAVAARAMLTEKFWALCFGIALEECERSCRRDSSWRVSEFHDALGFNVRVRNGGQIALRLGRAAKVVVVPGQASQHCCSDEQRKCPDNIESMAESPASDERHQE